ncbi:Ras GTPase-activating-like protein IQGAP1 [Chionoecetes opilio]|uniref:Ras GTPase-activating-like protein IQGAP1 n=1 Tax=Chionoecetes opilio TaxID=41210 RepID=A0A8J5CKE8_CHIOP|nr:Ras GTPase-activating-like protein IQGAP1 [Chionoecetes opilio]
MARERMSHLSAYRSVFSGVVGNLVYYRYINSAIVAPDAFDIVTVSPDEKLNNNQRRNLASIAKILQFAASKKGEELHWANGFYTKCLNLFIVECHEKFKGFFRRCCEVEETRGFVYNGAQYSEATLIVKPTIYITVQVVCVDFGFSKVLQVFIIMHAPPPASFLLAIID